MQAVKFLHEGMQLIPFLKKSDRTYGTDPNQFFTSRLPGRFPDVLNILITFKQKHIFKT
jgi:hypothetical protein